MSELRAIFLHQPWCDLIRLGYKTIETRSWGTKYRGPLLLCSAKRYDKLAQMITSKYQAVAHPDSFWAHPILKPDYQPLLGMGLVLANVVDCRPMEQDDLQAAGFFKSWSIEDKYAWVLDDIQAIEPVAITGRQGLFDPAAQGITLDSLVIQKRLKPKQIGMFDFTGEAQTNAATGAAI